jgi:hypothetical protein
MDYRSMAQSVLQGLPKQQSQPRQTSMQSDDERIAQSVWVRIQLELTLNKPSFPRSLMLV